MRALARRIEQPFHKVYFQRTDDTPYIYSILPDVEQVSWSTEKRTIAAKITRPLLSIITPRKWAQLVHEDKPEEWITEENWLR